MAQPSNVVSMSLVESQGGYSDDPQFERLADDLASQVFDITSANGRLWTLINRGNLETAVQVAADNRIKIRGIRNEVERLGKWPDPEPAQTFTQHKITREFGTALSEFQRIQKVLAEKERKLVNKPDPEQDAGLIELESDPQLVQQQAFEEQLREDEVAYQQGLIQDREQEIQGIEQGINELNDIFASLAGVIKQQGQTLDNIEANIYNVRDDTQRASHELTRAARWQRSSTGRKLCLLMILVVVSLFIIISVLL